MTETILSSTLPLCISLTLVLVSLKAFLPSIKFPVALFPTPEAPSSTILSSGKWNVFSDSAWRYKTVTQMWPFLKWELQYFSHTSNNLYNKCEGLVQQCREDYVPSIKVALSYSQVQINSKFTLHTYIMGFEKWKPFGIEILLYLHVNMITLQREIYLYLSMMNLSSKLQHLFKLCKCTFLHVNNIYIYIYIYIYIDYVRSVFIDICYSVSMVHLLHFFSNLTFWKSMKHCNTLAG